MKKKYKLHIKLLRFILDNEYPFTSVQLAPFLLKQFDTKDVVTYMRNIRCFVDGLEKSNLIEITEKHDLKITTDETTVEDFFVNARITVDGTKYISEQNLKSLNKTSVYTSIAIGIIVAITSVVTLINHRNNKVEISDEINESVRQQIELFSNKSISEKENKLDTSKQVISIRKK